jgi:hypothetical protein
VATSWGAVDVQARELDAEVAARVGALLDRSSAASALQG